MPGRKPCQPGCTCPKHKGRPFVSAKETRHQKALRRYWADPEGHREERRTRRAADPQHALEIERRSHEKNRSKRNERARGAVGARRRLKRKYGLTPERMAQMAEAQDGRCYLCGEPLDLATPRKAHVDHDHSCCRGQESCGTCIRGIACQLCNQGIGAFGDDPDRMRRVADRLEAAIARLAAQRATAPVQAELPLNVTPIRVAAGQ